jgi:hypothetical protein
MNKEEVYGMYLHRLTRRVTQHRKALCFTNDDGGGFVKPPTLEDICAPKLCGRQKQFCRMCQNNGQVKSNHGL